MRELSNHIVEVADRNSVPLTNLHLQKILYFSLGFHMRKTGEIDSLSRNTYDMPFEKWQYGPVVPSIYYSYRSFVVNHIESKGEYSTNYASWDEVIIKLLQVDPMKLVQTAQTLNGWAMFKNIIINKEYVCPYTLQEILEDFKK